ncbi:ISNCY-like element ISSymo1 family transposase [Candidatus Symbiobacter mobilis]|uniref:Transposase n=1 Tax=Candidatus Symbiobacter mobilis CR TaxID=946483 RepID=U5NB60_9BURK|nr:ISNCY-like element ISSymo1 family transposase [Candidatus Symbiobacter mobilis]AGX86823.1 transposase [Candidatus Symbiobacter mobilis CR]AGX86911.1 transposase [Candidatus Symbiobacter mobilis CR]AGX87468.1 transposase [Candidatus Symbiobacter mobilis CR]AGX87862.1 transposase [Candidatus Symbiobacter mobilis CR]AGX88420.1 transposase [Candidatus Symbiobacter mobilis CR]
MRSVINPQMKLGEDPIANIQLDLRSRDDIPKLLLGLQYIYTIPDVRKEVFSILSEILPVLPSGEKVKAHMGRPGMSQWQILVIGVVRLGLNIDYDRLEELVNQHRTLRQMLGHTDWYDETKYNVQTLKDNLRLFTPEILDRINQVVVKTGHTLVKKSPDDVLHGRCDSFVVETDVHFPTDLNLLFDAIKKIIAWSAKLAEKHKLSGWRQHEHSYRQFKKQYRHIQRLRRSHSKNEAKRAAKEAAIHEACEEYLKQAKELFERATQTRQEVVLAASQISAQEQGLLSKLQVFIGHAEKLSDQIRRRVINGERIPHSEKIFSLFEPHTEWISKGKAGVPVELGVKVCILEDQHRFILHHHVMEKQEDNEVAVPMVEAAKERFSTLNAVSFDKGFHSQENQKKLAKLLDCAALPKKGRCSQAEQERESSETFVKLRKAHSAVESAINGLEHFGLDMCPDEGIKGFKRYVSLSVLARNFYRIGMVVRQQSIDAERTTPPSIRRAA